MAGRRAGRTAQKKRTARLKQQRPAAAAWTENKMRVLSTELILERLAGLGIATSVDEIVQQARVEHAASAIAEGWRERLPVSPHRVDDDSLTSPRVCCGNGSFRSVAVSSSWPVSETIGDATYSNSPTMSLGANCRQHPRPCLTSWSGAYDSAGARGERA